MGMAIQALTCGPQGPVCALAVGCALLYSLIEAIKAKKMPPTVELIALILGFIGAIEMILP